MDNQVYRISLILEKVEIDEWGGELSDPSILRKNVFEVGYSESLDISNGLFIDCVEIIEDYFEDE